jgi:hypothetical protein
MNAWSGVGRLVLRIMLLASLLLGTTTRLPGRVRIQVLRHPTRVTNPSSPPSSLT